MKTNSCQVKEKKKTEKQRFGENTLKVLRSYLRDEWCRGGGWGDYGKYMQDVTYFCGLSGVRRTLLDTLLCVWQLYLYGGGLHCILNAVSK